MNDKRLIEKSSLKIMYDAKKNDVKAKIEYISTDKNFNKRRASYTCEGIVAVNKAIQEYMLYKKTNSLQELVDEKVVKLEGEAVLRYEFDFNNNRLVERRLRRSERRALEGIPYDDTPYVATHEHKEEPSEIVPPKEEIYDITESVNKSEIINAVIRLNPDVDFEVEKDDTGEVKCLLSSVSGDKLKLPGDFYYDEKNGITNKNKTKSGLYTAIEIRPLVKKEEPDVISEEKPKEEPKPTVIPRITDIINPEPFKGTVKKAKAKIKNLKVFNWGKIKKIVIGGLVIAGIAYLAAPKSHDSGITINNENMDDYPDDDYDIEYNYDGSFDTSFDPITVEPVDDYDSGIRIISMEEVPSYEEETVYNEPSEDVYEVDYNDTSDDVVEVPYEEPYSEPVYQEPTYQEPVYQQPVYQEYVAPVSYEEPVYEEPVYQEPVEENYEYEEVDMETRLNDVVGICYQNIGDIYQFLMGGTLQEGIQSCNVYELVSVDDRDAVSIINNARNYIVRNAYSDQNTSLTLSDVDSFLSQYINYVFEGGTIFDGQAIKAYDYLDDYSQYVVTVLGESVLQLYPGYEYSTPYANYNFEDLVGRITEAHGDLAASLMNGRSY